MKNSTFKLCKHGCGQNSAPERNECYKCRSKGIRERKPIDVVFYWLRKSAKKRRKEFTITLPWFRQWIISTGYMVNRGRLTDNLTIDRIRNNEGYTIGNLQILTKGQNSTKYWQEDVSKELGPQYEGGIPF